MSLAANDDDDEDEPEKVGLEMPIPKFKILMSSNTNVAVDRVLMSLKDLGFTRFVRVGNLKRVARSLLRYTCQNQSSDVEELQRLLKEDPDLSTNEVQYVHFGF